MFKNQRKAVRKKSRCEDLQRMIIVGMSYAYHMPLHFNKILAILSLILSPKIKRAPRRVIELVSTHIAVPSGMLLFIQTALLRRVDNNGHFHQNKPPLEGPTEVYSK